MYRKTVEELQKDQREKLVIDIRSEQDYIKETYPGAKHIFWEEFMEHIGEIPKELPVYLFCYTGQRSDEIAEDLSEQGYEIYSIEGGYRSYLRKKLADFMKEDDGTAERLADKAADAERSIIKKFKKTVWRPFTKAINAYEMIQDGDKIAVCISGGKDSMLMAKLFQELKRYSPVSFDVQYVVMDPGYNPENRRIIEDNARLLGIPITVFESNIFKSVYNVEKSPCYLCARMRRGYLYGYAQKLGCNKIALGHHFDDVIETNLMGMLYSGQLQTMMPKLHSRNFPGMELIRPLYFIREDDIKAWRDYNGLHFIQCACRFTDTCTTCNNGQNHSKRQETKELIRMLKKTNPQVEQLIFRSMENVGLDAVLAYKQNGRKHSFLDTYDSRTGDEGE